MKRRIDNIIPRPKPYRQKASFVYSEQVGVCRHAVCKPKTEWSRGEIKT